MRDACLELKADPNLNFYDDQPHVTVVYLFPLENRLGFEQKRTADLLAGEDPAGLVGSRLQVTVAPGETREVSEKIPPTASQLGVVADFYRAPGESEGLRRTIVPARCGWRAPTLVLGRRDLLVE